MPTASTSTRHSNYPNTHTTATSATTTSLSFLHNNHASPTSHHPPPPPPSTHRPNSLGTNQNQNPCLQHQRAPTTHLPQSLPRRQSQILRLPNHLATVPSHHPFCGEITPPPHSRQLSRRMGEFYPDCFAPPVDRAIYGSWFLSATATATATATMNDERQQRTSRAMIGELAHREGKEIGLRIHPHRKGTGGRCLESGEVAHVIANFNGLVGGLLLG